MSVAEYWFGFVLVLAVYFSFSPQLLTSTYDDLLDDSSYVFNLESERTDYFAPHLVEFRIFVNFE
jgi:hypothetical protein